MPESTGLTDLEEYKAWVVSLQHALDERDREVEYLYEIITELRQVHQKRFEVYEEHFQENQRLRKALEEIDNVKLHWGTMVNRKMRDIARQALAGEDKV